MLIYLIYDLMNVKDNYSPRDWDQIGTKLGTEHIIYKNLANFMYKKVIHVRRLQSVIFGMEMCILQNKTKCKSRPDFEGLEMQK